MIFLAAAIMMYGLEPRGLDRCAQVQWDEKELILLDLFGIAQGCWHFAHRRNVIGAVLTAVFFALLLWPWLMAHRPCL
jgi:hypothetical protein